MCIFQGSPKTPAYAFSGYVESLKTMIGATPSMRVFGLGSSLECEKELEEGAAQPVKDPGTPTATERAEHELTHWPFRSWCAACVMMMATGRQHRRLKHEGAVSETTRLIMGISRTFTRERRHLIEDAATSSLQKQKRPGDRAYHDRNTVR